ncbi:MAG: lactate utilization protein [Thermoprotei archaeon]|nr:MAG: lactate utilization protein [Thermoprotei archaeon]
MSFEKYFKQIVEAALDEEHRAAVARAVDKYMARKEASLRRLKVKEWAEELKEIRRETLSRVRELVGQAMDSMKDQGMNVYLAKDAEEANRLILELMGEEKELLKVKSLTSEEIELNEYLERHGVQVWETDVGAILLQLLKWKPSHPTGVSITVSRRRAAEAYSKLAGRKLPDDPKELVSFVRSFVRRKALEVKVGFSGANAIAADVGLIYILTNEANDRLVTTLPEKHIVLAGIEKIMPDRYTCELYSKVVPVYATGGATVTFMSTIGLSRSNDIERITVSPASGPSELHVILLDNGRFSMLDHPEFKEALTCIKCGGCLYVCPVWNAAGGFFSGEGPYMGGFGTAWTLFTRGLEAAALQAFTCTLCGRCREVCPMGIDTPKLVLKVRELAAEKGVLPPTLQRMAEGILERGTPYLEG